MRRRPYQPAASFAATPRSKPRTDTTSSEFSPEPSSGPTAELGVGAIISDSFSILFSNLVAVVVVAFVPTLAGLLISSALIGFDAAIGLEELQFEDGTEILAELLSFLIDMIVYTVTTGIVVQLAYDAKLSRAIRIGRYFRPAITALFPLAILSIVATLLAGIGFMALVVPGIWIYAVFSVMAPAVVIERAGFGGLGRSASLTKEYRWPVAGAYILAMICTMLLNALSLFVVSLVFPMGGIFGLLIGLIIHAALYSLGTGLVSIVTALTYARLREIKEGVSIDEIASVFE